MSISDKLLQLADIIESKADHIHSILNKIESYETRMDEIEKSIDALRNHQTEKELGNKSVHSMSSFLPLNLPLYSLVIFGVIPASLSDNMYVRGPSLLTDKIQELSKLLELEQLFPDLVVSDASKEEFIAKYASKSDAVLFTGKHENAQKLKKQLKKDVIFLFSGRGVNPVIIGKNPNIQEAIEKTCTVKLFNSGQDCAAPDCIFVHKSVSQAFLNGVLEELQKTKSGSYTDPNVRVGSLVEGEQLNVCSKQFQDHRENIVMGGSVDFTSSTVLPTVIYYPKFEKINFDEFFSPTFFIVEYEDEADIEQYFENPRYQNNAMYVTLFGESEAVENQTHSIVLKDAIINDVERGNNEYGGYSVGASFIQVGNSLKAQPLLISRDLTTYAQWQQEIDADNPIQKESKGDIDIYRIKGPLPGPKLLVFGAVHGNEICGPFAMHRLLDEIKRKHVRVESGELIFVPIANPAAYPHKRFCDVNLNNIFAENHNPQNKEEEYSQTLRQLIKETDYLLDVHSFPSEGVPFAFEDYDDAPTREFTASLGMEKIIAGWFNLEREQGRYEPAQCAREFNKVSAVIECGMNSDPNASNIAYRSILNASRHLGIIGGRSMQPKYQDRYEVEALHYRPSYDVVFSSDWKNFDSVQSGTTITQSLDGNPSVIADKDSVVLLPHDASKPNTEWFFLAKPAMRR